jgi:hypothetical protein
MRSQIESGASSTMSSKPSLNGLSGRRANAMSFRVEERASICQSCRLWQALVSEFSDEWIECSENI